MCNMVPVVIASIAGDGLFDSIQTHAHGTVPIAVEVHLKAGLIQCDSEFIKALNRHQGCSALTGPVGVVLQQPGGMGMHDAIQPDLYRVGLEQATTGFRADPLDGSDLLHAEPGVPVQRGDHPQG